MKIRDLLHAESWYLIHYQGEIVSLYEAGRLPTCEHFRKTHPKEFDLVRRILEQLEWEVYPIEIDEEKYIELSTGSKARDIARLLVLEAENGKN